MLVGMALDLPLDISRLIIDLRVLSNRTPIVKKKKKKKPLIVHFNG